MSATADVIRAAHTGEGVAEIGGRRVLVPGALPGERVRLALLGKNRGRVLEILVPSPWRVDPPCRHAVRCGGCDLMHAAPELQLELRRDAVLDQLRRVQDPLPEPKIHAPTSGLAYRSRARLSLASNGGRIQVGYHAPRSPKIVAVERCLVLRPELAPLLAALGELLAGSRGTGEAQIALGESSLPVLDVHWTGHLSATAFGQAHAWVEQGRVAGVRLWQDGASEPASFGDARARMVGADGQPLVIAAGHFAQPSDEGAQALARRVGELVPPGGVVVELFAGSGTLSVMVCPGAARYVAVESVPEAVDALRGNLSARGLRATVSPSDAEAFELRSGIHTVLLDPPRSGAPRSCAAIGRARPRQVIYVSCHPAALARDLRTLTLGGYRIEDVELFELFPQTSHVETVVRLALQKGARA